jgi:hypothetical protein
VGSILAALCCLGVAPIIGALSALGLSFLVNDLILIPLLVFFLGARVPSERLPTGRCSGTSV